MLVFHCFSVVFQQNSLNMFVIYCFSSFFMIFQTMAVDGCQLCRSVGNHEKAGKAINKHFQ